mmetsp:Transcript_5776/g.9209  ORF Transcript_5776/g.9209 Transcript_5776/m.9209 type:complete len:81 (+) Transcript_5776:1127-1369(+)
MNTALNGGAQKTSPLLVTLMSNVRIHRELFRMLNKFQNNYGLRVMWNIHEEEGKVLVERYSKALFDFSVGALSAQLPNKD